MGNISTAVVMCGGDSSRFGYVCKSLVMYKGRFIITYVFEALKEMGIVNPILKTNPSNNDVISYLARKYFDEFRAVPLEPRPMRYAIRDVASFVEDDFYLVVGNQPMPASHLDNLRQLKGEGDWVVSLYHPKTDGGVGVILGENNRVSQASEITSGILFMQHPIIVSKEIVSHQESEGYSRKLEQTIGKLLSARQIRGVIAPMPPEFDTWEMFEANKRYIDENLRR